LLISGIIKSRDKIISIMAKIKTIHAREILDSRGNPTLEVEVGLTNGVSGKASVPSGASVGKYEAVELRDNDPKRYQGKGVLIACQNVNKTIAEALKGKNIDQQKIDELLIRLDGTENKSKLGANAILGVSLACVRARAKEQRLSLYKSIAKTYKIQNIHPASRGGRGKKYKIPFPMFNIINGGKHAENNLDIQEFMIVPQQKSFKENLRVGAEIFQSLKKVLQTKNLDIRTADEGGYGPDLESNTQAIDLILEATKLAGYEPGKDIYLALDVAANTLYNPKEDAYLLKLEKTSLTRERLISLYQEWVKRYPIISIEDPFSEDDWEGWKQLSPKLKVKNSKLLVVGDDLTVTSAKRLEKAIERKAANAIIIKPNQIGTLTETIGCIKQARQNSWKVIISHRSGETCDSFISDLAMAVGADYIKAGGPSRGERVVKYNRLLEIEEKL